MCEITVISFSLDGQKNFYADFKNLSLENFWDFLEYQILLDFKSIDWRTEIHLNLSSTPWYRRLLLVQKSQPQRDMSRTERVRPKIQI